MPGKKPSMGREFQELPIGCKFNLNGLVYTKQSTRTAWVFQNGLGLVAYIGKREIVHPLAW